MQWQDIYAERVAASNGTCKCALQGQEACIHVQVLCTLLNTTHKPLGPILYLLEPFLEPSFTSHLILPFSGKVRLIVFDFSLPCGAFLLIH